MHFKNLLTTTHIWQAYHDLTVKTSRTQQCWVQHVRTVGCRDDNNAFIAFKTIHLNQHLV
ncbi:Uncharacterised protein [Vibrio cholerae]|nr:Uncharacterised protein [Vibrio cholerae]CSB31624.1 Uncharacterised protein [Vibrio cholerae]CSB59685.1 Uncharacterised protein [Vibrio cholerae]CSB67863.1 Uncharacterised protein [Vibrio cholerae]CSI63910.1 Uncharacterised protein [Vibrio cholerae]